MTGDCYVAIVLGGGLALLGCGLLVRDLRERWGRAVGALSWWRR